MSRSKQWIKLTKPKYGLPLGFMKQYSNHTARELIEAGDWEAVCDPSKKIIKQNNMED